MTPYSTTLLVTVSIVSTAVTVPSIEAPVAESVTVAGSPDLDLGDVRLGHVGRHLERLASRSG